MIPDQQTAVADVLCADARIAIGGERLCSAEVLSLARDALRRAAENQCGAHRSAQTLRFEYEPGRISGDQPAAHVAADTGGALDAKRLTPAGCNVAPMAISFCRSRGLMPPPPTAAAHLPPHSEPSRVWGSTDAPSATRAVAAREKAAARTCPPRALVVLHFVLNGHSLYVDVAEGMDDCAAKTERWSVCARWLRGLCHSDARTRPDCTDTNVEEMVAQVSLFQPLHFVRDILLTIHSSPPRCIFSTGAQVQLSQTTHWRKAEVDHHARWLLPLCGRQPNGYLG